MVKVKDLLNEMDVSLNKKISCPDVSETNKRTVPRCNQGTIRQVKAKTNKSKMNQNALMTGKGVEPLSPNYETGILTI